MNTSAPQQPADQPSPLDRLRPLLRVRQVREFTHEPLDDAQLLAITEVARWTGSAGNEQAWRFLVLRDTDTLRRLAEIGVPQTRGLRTASAAIAIVLPDEPEKEIHRTYDDGRAAERILIAASLLGLGAGINWVRNDVRAAIGEILGLPPGRIVRTFVALGHPTEAARHPKAAPGMARLPREQVVFEERLPAE